jgi:hypothetical protein
LTTKIRITPGQAHDGRSAANMFDSLVPGDVLLADHAYDSDVLHSAMAKRGVRAKAKSNITVPSQPDTKSTPKTILPSSNSRQPESG